MFGRNGVKTVFLLVAMTGLLMLVGQMVGGTGGLLLFFLIAMAMNFGSYWFSDSITLKMMRAREVSEAEAPVLHRAVDRVAGLAGMPKPKVCVVDTPSPNAFATGRNPSHAAVAATTGILRILDERELTAVLAHEMGHVKNRDTLISAIVAMMAGTITLIAYMAQWALIFGGFGRGDDDEAGSAIGSLALIILAPIAAALIQFGVSRAREYGADETGAKLLHDPEALASALQKLERGAQAVPMETNPSTAHLYIVNPLRGAAVAKLFSTHPPVADRVERLREIGREMGVYF